MQTTELAYRIQAVIDELNRVCDNPKIIAASQEALGFLYEAITAVHNPCPIR